MRDSMLRVLRVPAAPAPPPGSRSGLRTFRASPRYFRYSVATWVLKQLSAAGALFTGYFFTQQFVRNIPFGYFGLLEQVFIVAFIVQLPFSFAMLRLDFELRWYMLSDRSLRIRSGLISVREQTMAFANIQHITVRQNPLQRLFGIATVAVRAAGGGSGSTQSGNTKATHAHEATFEGVDNASEIRDLIRQRVRQHRDAGLGDPDEVRLPRARANGSAAPASGDASAAARRLLAEVRALRTAVTGTT
ncbi:MAG TPA: PH domain-containing protein [Longimicrobiales bacterium]|nr:PH domain-containing protein [Longimicrobiales bacterium]